MLEKTFGFPRRARLLNAADFRTVFEQVDVKSPSEFCLLLARSAPAACPRIGFIISKKNIKHAVQRNRIKRHTREYFRLHQETLPSIDIIFMARKGLDRLSDTELDNLISKQFNKLIKRAKLG